MSQASVDRTSRVPVALLEPEARERQRAVEALTAAQLAEPAVSYALGRLLAADPDVPVRAAAAAALGRVRGEPGVQLDARPDTQLDAQPGARPGAQPGAQPDAQPDAQPGAQPDAQPDAQFDALAASWLLEALRDGSPVVRDAAVRALAARRCARAFGALTQLAQTDQVWWVRRAAVYALGTVGASSHGGAAAGGTAALGGPGAAWPDVDGEAPLAVSSEATIAAARAALSDPFWRVRHAAVQVLALCGARTPSLRDQILAEVEGGSADYLRALWGPALISATASATGAPVWESKLPAPLRDRDPAVVTARLAAMDSPPPLALVELLCDPHVPLRELAAARLTRAGDAEAFAAALRWLEEPRIPHVAETVTDLLDGLGDAARELAADVLAGAPRCGAARWAVGWVVATRDAELGEAAWRCAVRCSVRDVALPLASADELREILAGAGAGAGAASPLIEELGSPPREALGPHLRDDAGGHQVALPVLAAEELLRRPAAVRRRVLAEVPVATCAQVQARLAAAADELDSPHVVAALRAASSLPRAVALARLAAAGRLDEAAWTRALADLDPKVREAVIAAVAPPALLALLRTEPDPWVRRAAGQALLRAAGADSPAGASLRRAGASAVTAEEVALALTSDDDPWLRAQAAPLLDLGRPAHRARLTELAAERSPMVQAAVIECLARMSEPELAAALEESPSGAFLAWRAAADVDGPAAEAAPESAAEAAPESAAEAAPKFAAESASEVASTPDAGADAAPVVRAALDAPPAGPRTAAPSEAATARRIFGRSGVTASPLVISGAFDLSPGSLHVAAEAGVDLFFWEETYAAMTRFLRARRQHTRAQVVTGSYHADGPSITRDVERALRRLRRETLDVFLLFWARSSARLDEDAFAALARLRQAGKVRAVGFSTHDRALASDALARAPWDVVMTRHSAAHPGIEAELLPQAQAAGAGILTFSALCYGRMVAGAGAPSAADCYRYSLSQPGVTACISAPRRHRELVENLEVLARPVLDEPALAALRAHGQGVRIENQRFGSLIRQPTRDAAAAAMAMLESTLPPVAGEPAGPAAPGVPGVPGEPSVASFRAARRRGSLAQPGPSSRLRRGRL